MWGRELVTAYSTASRNAARHPVPDLGPLAQLQHIAVHGMASAFTLAAVLDVLALAVIVIAMRGRRRVPAVAKAELELEAVRVPADS